jgi:RNA polymerase sigma-70 factor (ECF subfamily)
MSAVDSELQKALISGDVEALSRVYDSYGVHAYSVALRMLGDPSRAEEVVFDCFLQLWEHADRFSPERESLRAYLIGTVRRRALSELKGSVVSETSAEPGSAGAVLALHDPWAAAPGEVGKAVREGLADLPSEQRQALELACFSGCSYREIAETTHAPVTSVKSAMRLALERLHSFLQIRGLVQEVDGSA